MLNIPYSSDNFPRSLGPEFQGSNTGYFTWTDLLWAAITVGKAKRSHLLRFGRYSRFEIIVRASTLFSNLKQGTFDQLQKSNVYRTLDPTEKGATSYFIGLMCTKLFAERFLGVPWLMHLDVYRDRSPATLGKGQTRPDLVGMNSRGDWIVMEAKGRSGRSLGDALETAKDQTRNLRTVSGRYPALRVALAAYFERGNLCVSWTDPEDYHEYAEDLDIPAQDFLSHYYQPLLNLVEDQSSITETRRFQEQTFLTTRIEDADMIIGVHDMIVDGAPFSEIAESLPHELHNLETGERTKIGLDGILIETDSSWSEENMIREPERRVR